MLCEEYIRYNPDNPGECDLAKQVMFEVIDEITNTDELNDAWLELDDFAQEQVLLSVLKKIRQYSAEEAL